MSSEKRTERITVHLTEAELRQVDQERAERVRAAPGATLTRSGLVVQILLEHFKRKADERLAEQANRGR